ncbi:MAG: hypothetical protein ACLU3I_11800 [Acutalibacteraceae bacterium]
MTIMQYGWRRRIRLNVLDVAADGRANGFVERIAEFFDANFRDLVVTTMPFMFEHSPKSTGSSGSLGSTSEADTLMAELTEVSVRTRHAASQQTILRCMRYCNSECSG